MSIKTPSSASVAMVVGVALVALYVGVRLTNLTAYSLWGDEIFSLNAARLELAGLLDLTAQDAVHPPLFYILLRGWIAVGGDSLLWLKLFPVMTAIVTLVPLFLLARALRLGRWERLLAFALVAVNSYLAHYSQELRMYQLLMLLAVTSLWAFARFLDEERRWGPALVVLLLVNLALVYSHYYGWLVVGVEGIFLLAFRRRLVVPFAASIVALGLAYAPWVYKLATTPRTRAGLSQEWRARPGAGDVARFFGTLNGPYDAAWLTLVGLGLFGIPIVVLAVRAAREGERRDLERVALLALAVVVPVAAAFTASSLSPRSIWNPRYLIVAAAPYLLLAAIAASSLRPAWLRAAVVVAMVGWAVGGAFHPTRSDHRVPFEEVVERIVEAESGGTEPVTIYAVGWKVESPIRFYLESIGATRFRVVRTREVDEIEDDHFWVAYPESRRGELVTPPGDVLRARGYRLGEVVEAGSPGDRVFVLPVWRAR